MAHNPCSNRGRGAPSRASPDDTYCAIRDDRERRNALVSRDLRIVGCRLATVAGLVTLAIYTPVGSMVTGTFDRIDSRRMAAALYRSGKKIAKCSVRIDSLGRSNGVAFWYDSSALPVSYNEMLTQRLVTSPCASRR